MASRASQAKLRLQASQLGLTPVIDKLARAKKLHAEAEKLSTEAFEQLTLSLQPLPVDEEGDLPPITELDRQRARQALQKIGVRFP